MRGLRPLVLTVALLGLVCVLPVGAGDEEAPHRRRHVTAAEVRALDALVGQLAGTRHLRSGLTWTSCGGPYSEAVRSVRGGANARDEAAEAFDDLARRGPDAVPVLLAHLDDTTPTELVVHSLMNMWYATEVEPNPLDEEELRRLERVLEEAPPPGIEIDLRARRGHGFAAVEEHVVTVGDVCFAILGQITNRPYEAVRAQPTACIVVNSPTREPRLARAVRSLWDGVDVRRELERRLRLDLERESARYRAGAALRLALYYDVHLPEGER